MQPEKIKNVLLKDQIYEYIVDMIQNGEVEPGQKLAEQPICDALGVSRTPVREALTRLAAEGVIDKTPRKGFSVRAVSQKEKDDTYIVQYTLEALAAELYLKRCDAGMLAEQEHMVEQMAQALQSRDFTQYIQVNYQIHFHVIEHCGNGVLIDLIRTLYMSPVPVYYEERSDEIVPVLQQCVQEHREMLRCYREKDAAQLKELYYSHLLVDKRSLD